MIGALAGAAALGAGAWYWRERGHRRTHAMAGGLHADRTLPHDAEFELYHNDFSLCSKKIRMCLMRRGRRRLGPDSRPSARIVNAPIGQRGIQSSCRSGRAGKRLFQRSAGSSTRRHEANAQASVTA